MAIVDWLDSNIDSKIKYTGNNKEVHFNCPFCSDKRHRMYVSLDTGGVYCHNCNWHGNIVKLIQSVEGVSLSKAESIFQDVKGNLVLPESISKDAIANMFIPDLRADLAKRPIPLPQEYSPIKLETKNIYVKNAIKYLHSRGITDKQIVSHKMGYCMDGEYRDRIIIPITENGDLKFWVARASNKHAYLKEKSPSDEEYQISKSEVLFNIDVASHKYHSAVLCEGIFDALSFSDIGVSMLGKSLYQSQLNILLDYRDQLTNGVYVALDWDARDNATEIAETLSEYFKVYIINIPRELDDPNNSLQQKGKSYMWKLIADAEEYSEFSCIRRMFA